jgi:hypothetical protein
MIRRILLCSLLFASIWVVGHARPEENTLRQALAAKHLPFDAAKLANLDKSITSWAELDDPGQYVIAYYLDNGSEELNPPLFLDRYDRNSSEWKSARLPEGGEKSSAIDDVCYGSILSIISSAGRFFVETHINPSAGCLLVLSGDLKLEASLSGWFLGHLGDDALVYHRSEVHFAPVHPAEIAIYDLRTKHDFTIFPPKTETPIRQALAA